MQERYPHLFKDAGTPSRPCFFLLVIVRGRTMGKLVSIVTTCLVVLSNRLQFLKNWQKRRTPRRTVMVTTDRRRVSFQITKKI